MCRGKRPRKDNQNDVDEPPDSSDPNHYIPHPTPAPTLEEYPEEIRRRILDKMMKLADRFWPKVIIKGLDECWEWNASMGTTGYGQISVNGKPCKAHRVSFFIANGKWPEPSCLHSCDNKKCVNPSHLREGNHKDNYEDMRERGQITREYPSHRGNLNKQHKLSEDDVWQIRTLYGQCTASALAAAFNVTSGHIKNVAKGRDRKYG